MICLFTVCKYVYMFVEGQKLDLKKESNRENL